MELSVVFPPSYKSLVVKEFLAGRNLKVIAFSKDDNVHQNSSWEANVQHEILDLMEKLEAAPRTFTEVLSFV